MSAAATTRTAPLHDHETKPSLREELQSMPVATGGGARPAGVVALGADSSMRQDVAPSGPIVSSQRTIGFLPPPDNMALQDAMTIRRPEIEPEMKKLLGNAGRRVLWRRRQSRKIALGTMGQEFGLAVLVVS